MSCRMRHPCGARVGVHFRQGEGFLSHPSQKQRREGWGPGVHAEQTDG